MESASPVVPGLGWWWRPLAVVHVCAVAAPVMAVTLGGDILVMTIALGGGLLVAMVILVAELVGLRDRMPAIARFGLPPVVDEAEERRRVDEWNRGYAVIGQIMVGLLVLGGPLTALFGAPRLGGTSVTLPDPEVLAILLLGSGLLIGTVPSALFAWRAAQPRAGTPAPGDPASVPAAPTWGKAIARGVLTAAGGVAVTLVLSMWFGETTFGIATSFGVVLASMFGTRIGFWRQQTVHRAALAAAGAPPAGHTSDPAAAVESLPPR